MGWSFVAACMGLDCRDEWILESSDLNRHWEFQRSRYTHDQFHSYISEERFYHGRIFRRKEAYLEKFCTCIYPPSGTAACGWKKERNSNIACKRQI